MATDTRTEQMDSLQQAVAEAQGCDENGNYYIHKEGSE